MKKIVIVLMLCSVLLFGCTDDNIENKYFVRIDTRVEDLSKYTIVYAKDTKVKYLIFRNTYGAGITPLYNKDGSLQTYEEE